MGPPLGMRVLRPEDIACNPCNACNACNRTPRALVGMQLAERGRGGGRGESAQQGEKVREGRDGHGSWNCTTREVLLTQPQPRRTHPQPCGRASAEQQARRACGSDVGGCVCVERSDERRSRIMSRIERRVRRTSLFTRHTARRGRRSVCDACAGAGFNKFESCRKSRRNLI